MTNIVILAGYYVSSCSGGQIPTIPCHVGTGCYHPADVRYFSRVQRRDRNTIHAAR